VSDQAVKEDPNWLPGRGVGDRRRMDAPSRSEIRVKNLLAGAKRKATNTHA
jgi:hypothetical protein